MNFACRSGHRYGSISTRKRACIQYAARLIERGGVDYQAFIQDMEDSRPHQRSRRHSTWPSACRDDRSRSMDSPANHGWNLGGQGRLCSQRISVQMPWWSPAPETTQHASRFVHLVQACSQAFTWATSWKMLLVPSVVRGRSRRGCRLVGDVHPIAAETAFIDAVARTERKEVNP